MVNTRAADRLKLRLQLAFARFEWSYRIACVLCAAGASGWLWGIPHLRAEMAAQQQALVHAMESLRSMNEPVPAMRRPPAEQRLAAFYDTLGETRYAEQQVKTLFAIAGKNNLALSQAEYRLAANKDGRYHTYQIRLPVKGSYGAIRQFCEQTLLVIPFASLDDVSFTRDTIASPALEAKLRFTLYLADAPMQMTSGSWAEAP